MAKRREFLISTVALSTGLVVAGCSKTHIPGGTVARSAADGAAGSLFFSSAEMAQLAEIAEIIVPTTDTPGARAANVHGFIDQLMAQWAVPKTRAAMRALLAEIDATAKRGSGAEFLKLPPAQRVEVISAIDAAAFNPQGHDGKSIAAFVRLKEWVFLGYYHSQIGATQELQYQLVPGRYEECAPLSNIGRAWVGDWGDVFLVSKISLSGA